MSPIDEPSRGNLVIVEANLTCLSLSLQRSEKSAHASFIIAIDFFLSLSFSPPVLNASNFVSSFHPQGNHVSEKTNR